MIDVKHFSFAIAQIAEEKNIPEDKILDVIQTSIAAAYKKDYGERSQIIKCLVDKELGKIRIFKHKVVVELDEEGMVISNKEVELDEEGNPKKTRFNPERHIPLSEALEVNDQIQIGEELIEELEPKDDFGRIAAQTAKQVLMQKIREIERSVAFDEYKDKIGEIYQGTIQRIDRGIIFVELGKGVGLLFPTEQVRSDNYKVGGQYKFLIQSVEQTEKEPNILLSRKSNDFVRKLFTLEVPEIFSNIIEIVGIARDAGVRTKIAVKSKNPDIDPVGACVGQRGSRVQNIISELGGEKIDIIEYNDDINEYIKAAIAPAGVISIEINEEEKKASVIVPEDQLSLAIGGFGQNVRLASRLVGYTLDLNPDNKKVKEDKIEEDQVVGEPIEEPIEEKSESTEVDSTVKEDN